MEIRAILKAHRSTGTVESTSVDPKGYWRVIVGYHNLSQAAAPRAAAVPSFVAQWDITQTPWQLIRAMCLSPSNKKRGLEFLTIILPTLYSQRSQLSRLQAKLLHYLCCIMLFKEETLIKTLCTTEDLRKPPQRFRNLPHTNSICKFSYLGALRTPSPE